MPIVNMKTELFPLLEQTIDDINKKSFFTYKAHFSDFVLSQFGGIEKAYYNAAKLFRMKYGYSAIIAENGLSIVSVADVEKPQVYAFNREGERKYKIDLVRNPNVTKLCLFKVSDIKPLRTMFYQSIHDSLLKLGFKSNGYTYYSDSEDLVENFPRSNNPFFSKIQDFFHVYLGFNIKLWFFDQKPFLHIQPRCVFDFEKDLYSLYANQNYSFDEIVETFPYVLLPIQKTASLRSFWNKTASEPIDDRIFDGLSFLQFAKSMYPELEFKEKSANLVIVVPRGNRSVPWYFSSEHVKPSLSFETLSQMDRDLHSRIISKMKAYSSKRKDLVMEYSQKMNGYIFFDDVIIKFSESFSHESSKLELKPEEFNVARQLFFFTFPRPWVRFRNSKTLSPIDVSRETGHLGAPGDLRKSNGVRCFDVPEEINVKLLIDKKLENDAYKLIYNFGKGIGNYNGFTDIFGVTVNFSTILVDDFLSDLAVYSKINPKNEDCVLIFGPRTIENDPIKTKKIYTFSETEILNKGVPVQFIADDPSFNPQYDKSLKSKSIDPDYLFGIGLNILGKIGANILVLSPSTTDYFLPNSVVIGYNIARIFEPLTKDIFQDKTPRDLVADSIPLAAPIVMLSHHGADIIQQYAYEISDETALFSGEQGKRILSEINPQVSNVIIHKDGLLYPKELNDLSLLQEEGRRIIPVSIISGSVPRLFSSISSYHFCPPEGTVFNISPNDFLVSTTLTGSRYIPEHRGWPNPILVRFHEIKNYPKLSATEKLQLLYQIWSFTRVHIHSQLPLRRPLSIHYCNLIAEFLRKAGDRKPKYFKKFKGKKNRLGYTPRIFL